MKGEPVPNVLPRWYQDLSIPQMRSVFALGDIMRVDYAERVTGRTQRVLGDIGVTSTFVRITAEQIKKIRRTTDLDPVKFLCEIYRTIAGKSFVDEEYKKVYDCNERIILSAIAFLTLPETVIELHRRIPMGDAPKLRPKPVPGKTPSRRRAKSPYLEPLFVRPDWLAYKKQLDIWRRQRERTAIPRVILPTSLEHSGIYEASQIVALKKVGNERRLESYQEEKADKKKDSPGVLRIGNKTQLVQEEEKKLDRPREVMMQMSNLSTFTERQSELEPIEEKVLKNQSSYPRQERVATKSWLGGKDTQLIITDTTVNDDSTDCPISLGTSGFAYVTRDNSDESFFAALNLDDAAIKKTYPRGRENLSRRWQEWLQDVEEDYMSVEKEANKILKSVEKTLKLMGPEPACDSCCACRQTRKANIKYHKTKTPRTVIDSVALDGEENMYVVGSLAMNSPAPSPSESTEDIPEVIASHDEIIKKRIVSGVTNNAGETTYHVSGVSKHVEHVPRKVASYAELPKPIKNVPPCGCAIEKTINEGLPTVVSDDNIPWTKNRQLCVGKKYRPQAGGASSCKEYPDDRSCRRNPFKKKLDEGIYAAMRARDNAGKDDYPPEKRNMYSIADFQPCGDEDGMAVCGGPWGAVNVPDEEELARRAAEEKFILESPPCGDKPGRAICGAPFGARHPIPKKPQKDEDDEEDEEEELDEEELKERKRRDREARKKAPEPTVDEKRPNRDPRCSTVSEKNLGTHKSEPTTGKSSKQKLRKSKIRNSEKEKMSKENEKQEKSVTGPESPLSLQSLSKTRSKLREKSKEEVEHGKENAELTRKQKLKEVKNQWNKMKKLASRFSVKPAILPGEAARICKRESGPICDEDSTEDSNLGEASTKEGPFGWRTKSEQELPPEKTLVYLVEPEEPVKRVAVRAGGRPCKCRENRNAKKILLYGVSGTTKDEKGKRGEKLVRVIDGLIYITPTPSVRNSDEYIPEYDLYDSPYEKCTRLGNDNNFKYIERYLGPKSLMGKKPRVSHCSCSKTEDEVVKDTENMDLQRNEKESAEKRWKRAFQDEGLVDFFSRCRDNVPCWLRCAEFSKQGCCTNPRSLQVKRPVCECKYERKIVKRDEEKENWLRRQARLKNLKKLPYSRVAGLSRPMQTETDLVISDVKRITREDDDVDDIEYCVTGIAQNRVMGPAERILSGVGMHTPEITPEPSKKDLKIIENHRHWSPTNIHARPAFSTNTQAVQLRDSNQRNPRNNYCSETDKSVAAEQLKIRKHGSTEDHDKSLGRNIVFSKEADQKMKKPHSVPTTIEQYSATHSVRGTSRKKSTTKFLGEADKSNIRERKSTGSILSKDGKVDAQDKMKDISHKTDINELLKVELENMANEGFLFAKLPACWQFPQLQYWLMYRKGIALPQEEKKKLMDQSLKIWSIAEKRKPKKIQAPLFEVPQEVMDNWNYDHADKIKREIALKRETFESRVRKLRVLQARDMWGLMEFGKFPGVSFKKAYFTYQASKEADGFVFKPWENK